ncbi:hypothetical protein B7R21_17940 [Subtercola boreus]|uniref:Uncharacterized protein n=1 Tax=Subtercola boreus TaxID=120213 RepID=A0A3E0VBH4_9MICO|nr:hypothetical protein B7R21_17940 [Subtercola boreus]
MAAVVFVLIGLSLAGMQLMIANDRGSTYKCIIEGPRPSLAAHPDVVTGSVSYWPLGRTCYWASAAGDETIATYAGNWPVTFIMGGFLVGAVVLAGAKGTTHRRRADNQLSAWAEDEETS